MKFIHHMKDNWFLLLQMFDTCHDQKVTVVPATNNIKHITPTFTNTAALDKPAAELKSATTKTKSSSTASSQDHLPIYMDEWKSARRSGPVQMLGIHTH